VWTTCNGRAQDEHVRAYARSRVYRSGKAWRDIKKARGDQGTADGVLCVSAEGSGLNFTCKMRGLGQVPAGYVRRDSKRSRAILTLPER